MTLVVAAPPKVIPAPIAGAEYDVVGDGGAGSEKDEEDMNEKVDETSVEDLCGSGTDSGILAEDMNPKADDVVGASPSSWLEAVLVMNENTDVDADVDADADSDTG